MIPRFSTKSLLNLTAIFAALLTLFVCFQPGVVVTVHNSGTETATNDVRVHVTGRTYRLGHLKNYATKVCTVRSEGESHVEITYTLSNGTEMHHVVDCYIEPGYRGRVEIDIENGTLGRTAVRI